MNNTEYNTFKSNIKKLANEYHKYAKETPLFNFAEWITQEMQIEEPQWIPEANAIVYIADTMNKEKFFHTRWGVTHHDEHRLNHNLVFKSKEEAIKRAEELLSK